LEKRTVICAFSARPQALSHELIPGRNKYTLKCGKYRKTGKTNFWGKSKIPLFADANKRKIKNQEISHASSLIMHSIFRHSLNYKFKKQNCDMQTLF